MERLNESILLPFKKMVRKIYDLKKLKTHNVLKTKQYIIYLSLYHSNSQVHMEYSNT